MGNRADITVRGASPQDAEAVSVRAVVFEPCSRRVPAMHPKSRSLAILPRF
jgi:hypothetical protein